MNDQEIEDEEDLESDEYYEEPFDSEEVSAGELVTKNNYAQKYGSELSSLNESEAAELGISKP